MVWKKPKWVQKAQKAITPPPAPRVIQNIQKATQKAVNKVGDGLQEINKKVIQPVTTSAPIKAIQAAAQKAVDTTGDVLRGDKSVFGTDMNQKAKPKGESMTSSLVDDGSGQQRAARQLEVDMKMQKALSGGLARQGAMVDRRIDAAAERDFQSGKLMPIFQKSSGSDAPALPNVPKEETLSELAKRQKTDKVAGWDDIVDPATLAGIKKNFEYVKNTAKDILSEGDDRTGINSRTFFFRFGNVSSKAEQEAFTKAYREGNKKEMERMIKIMEERKSRQ